MSTSMPRRADPGASSTGPRLRIVEELENRKESNRIYSVLANGALSIGRRLKLAAQRASRSSFARRIAGWWSRIRGWLRPALRAVARSGIALPVWLATNGPVQRAGVQAACAAGRLAGEALYISSDAVTWLLWRAGRVGQSVARWYGFSVERVINTVESAAPRLAHWLGFLAADKSYIRIVHDVAGIVVVVRLFTGLVSGPVALAIALASLVGLSAERRQQAREAITRLLRVVKEFFTTRGGAGAPVPATAGAPPTRVPGLRQPSQHRSKRRR